MKIKYVLLVLFFMIVAVVFSIKLATVLLLAAGLVTLIGLGAAASAVLSIKPSSSHCTDENSPLINAIFGEENGKSH